MAHRVISSMDFYKFCFIAFLVFNNGFPIKGVPEAQSDGPKAPSAKECRAHIEAALEQYWETDTEGKKDSDVTPDSTPSNIHPSKSLHTETEGPQSEDETDQDVDDTDPPVDVQTQDETQEGEDDEEEEDNDNESQDDSDEHKHILDEELGTDNEEEEEEEEGSEDEESDEDLEDEDEEEHDEGGQEEKVGELKESEDETEEDEEDDVEDTESEITGTGDETEEVTGEQKEVAEEEEEEDDEDEEEEEEDDEEEELDEEEEVLDEEEEKEEADEEDEEAEQEEEEEGEEEAVQEEEEGEDEEEEGEEEEKEEAGEEEEEEETEGKAEAGEEEEEEEEEGEEEEEEEEYEEEDTGKDESTEELEKDFDRGDKVTGETHSAPVGMAPELSETEPTSDQPEASPVQEEVTLESPPEETAEEEEEEAEEEEEEETVEEPEVIHEEDDDLIENIYEEEDEDDTVVKPGETVRSRDHVDAILGLDDIGTNYDLEEEKLAQSIFKEIKKIHTTSIKPMEMLYKYAESTTRLLGDAEIFSKPMVLFLGPWSSGKTTIINYLLGLERTPTALKTGTGITDLDFTVINYGEQRRTTSGTALAAEWTYAGLQRFGQGFLDHFKGVTIPHTLLKKITLVDTPGIIESKKNSERGYPFNDAFQWFIDRADAIYVVLDPTKVDIGAELGSVLDQLKGREARFILNKADTIRRSDLMRVVGQLFWNLSPLMSSTEAPVIYAVSLTTKPFQPSAPARFLADQENNFLYDLRDTIDKHAENRILYARRHAVRVRNHCKMVDCYLSTYYRHKSIFSNKKNVAKLITENPADYNIYEGLSSMTNVSRYDLPDPAAYRSFFATHALYDFKPLASTCSYFRGCPMDKLDLAISNELPELLAKYKKAKLAIPAPVKQEGR